MRWAGFVSPTQDGVYTFQWARSGSVAGDRVKLWIDNVAVFEQWASLATANPQVCVRVYVCACLSVCVCIFVCV